MIITFDWLKDHLKTNLKEKNLLEQLTNIGLEVESVESLSGDNESFKVAEIIKTEKHPNADRLKICDVNIGEDEIKNVLYRFEPRIDNVIIEVSIYPDSNEVNATIQYDIVGEPSPSQIVDVLLFPARV